MVVVSSYTRFDNLAHGPRGTEATNSMWVFRLDDRDGSLTLLSVTQGEDNGARSTPAALLVKPKASHVPTPCIPRRGRR